MNRSIILTAILILIHLQGASQVNFENLTKFEKKIDLMEWNMELKACNSYIDKQLAKGRLTQDEMNFAYYIKCRLYNSMNYNFWGTNFDVLNKRACRMPQIYPYSEVYPINQADTLIYYSKLFLKSADTSSLVYRAWFEVYDDIYGVVGYGLDSLVQNAQEQENYYAENRAECDDYFPRLEFLKQPIVDFHPLNQLGIELSEYRLKRALGILTESEEDKLIQQVADYMHDRFDTRDHEGIVFWGSQYKDFTKLRGFGDDGIQDLLKELYRNNRDLARNILTHCHEDITNSFAAYSEFDTTWRVVETDVLKNERLIDLRDSTRYDTFAFPIYTTIRVDHNVPEGDTIVISKVRCDDCDAAELVEQVSMTGTGSAALTVITYHYVPGKNDVYNLWVMDMELVSNRGVRKFGFRANIVGQNREHITDSIKKLYQEDFVEENYPYYYQQVLQINCNPSFGTDTLKVYQYPNNTTPIYTIVPAIHYEAPKQIHPLEMTQDSLYHFNLLGETSDAYKIIYSNYHWDYEIGWIKKADLDTTASKLENIVKVIDLTQFFSGCEYIELRNPYQEIFAPNAAVVSFSDYKLVPQCKRFKYVRHWDKTGEAPTMVVLPCEQCTDPVLLEWGSAKIEWADGRFFLVEGVND